MEKLKEIKLPGEVVRAPEECTALTDVKEKKKFRFPKLSAAWEKMRAKPFPWKNINKRGAVVAACLAVIAVAGYVNVRYGLMAAKPAEEAPKPENTAVETGAGFFASAVIDRERARGEALEVLMNITEDEGAGEEAKSRAFTQMERIANETSWEIDIENLVKAKGFQECVAVINEDSASIVVSSDGLTPAEIAQIKEIVYLEAQIVPGDVKIIEKKPAA